MKIPKKLKICGLNYTIKMEDSLHANQGLAGEHCTHKLLIRIQKKDYEPQKMEQTFFHEVMHAIDDHYLNNKLSEDQVSVLSNGFYQVLKDNRLI